MQQLPSNDAVGEEAENHALDPHMTAQKLGPAVLPTAPTTAATLDENQFPAAQGVAK